MRVKSYNFWWERDLDSDDIYAWCKRFMAIGFSIIITLFVGVCALILTALMVYGTINLITGEDNGADSSSDCGDVCSDVSGDI